MSRKLPRFSQVNDEDHGSTPCGGSAALSLHAPVHGPPADRIGGRHRGEARGRGEIIEAVECCGQNLHYQRLESAVFAVYHVFLDPMYLAFD